MHYICVCHIYFYFLTYLELIPDKSSPPFQSPAARFSPADTCLTITSTSTSTSTSLYLCASTSSLLDTWCDAINHIRTHPIHDDIDMILKPTPIPTLIRTWITRRRQTVAKR